MQNLDVQVLVKALDDMKAENISTLDVRQHASIMDYLIIACGTSSKHVQSLANLLLEKAKDLKIKPLGIEGAAYGEWILVDLGDIVVHLMLEETRDFYNLEKLWHIEAAA
ncbi:MAG: ribosome silencing factor [Gammaproteobacteria bacterium]